MIIHSGLTDCEPGSRIPLYESAVSLLSFQSPECRDVSDDGEEGCRSLVKPISRSDTLPIFFSNAKVAEAHRRVIIPLTVISGSAVVQCDYAIFC